MPDASEDSAPERDDSADTSPRSERRRPRWGLRILVVDEGMTTGFMRDQAFALRGIRSEDVVFITAPFTGYGWSADGQSIDVVDQPGMEALGTAIRQDRLADYGRASIIP